MRRLILCIAVGGLLVAFVGAIAGAALLTNPVDQRLAARAQIRLADLPPGWRISTASSADTGGQSTCLSKPVATATGKSERAFAWRDVSSSLDVATAWGRVGLFRTVREARRVFAVGSSQKIWDCFTAEVKQGLHGVTATRQSRVPLQAIGAPAVGRELLVRVEQNGVAIPIGLHLDIAQKHRGVVIFIHMSMAAPIFTVGQESLVLRRMVARLPSQ